MKMMVYTVYSSLCHKNVFLIQVKEDVVSVPKKARGWLFGAFIYLDYSLLCSTTSWSISWPFSVPDERKDICVPMAFCIQRKNFPRGNIFRKN